VKNIKFKNEDEEKTVGSEVVFDDGWKCKMQENPTSERSK